MRLLGSGVVCINGAAAHHVVPGDLVIIATFTELQIEGDAKYAPTVVLVNGRNEIVNPAATEIAGPHLSNRGL